MITSMKLFAKLASVIIPQSYKKVQKLPVENISNINWVPLKKFTMRAWEH